ncbi:hypothetical protein [Paenibacillus silvisoli]|uniref:hypothetical protein n=1 Tax=Paenibacillus silvisoli TaxID=3110539 RepID=UPI0028050149|nr:hypothetical protein [Paenibacillus silvisoli]
MRFFRMKAESEGNNGLQQFLEQHYISCGRPGSKEAEDFVLFASVMQDGDYIVVTDGDRIVLGDLGDYFYNADCDNDEDKSGHRRGVTWLRSLDKDELHPELISFLEQEGKIGMLDREVSKEQVERFLRPSPPGEGLIDEAAISEAIRILKTAMRSEDAERRERAAIAILQAAQWFRK